MVAAQHYGNAFVPRGIIWLTDYNMVLARYSEVVGLTKIDYFVDREEVFDSDQGIGNFLGQKKVVCKHKVLCISYLAVV